MNLYATAELTMPAKTRVKVLAIANGVALCEVVKPKGCSPLILSLKKLSEFVVK